ncbi:hypothetical protein Tco_0770570 [Tanacetum coccineum]|uniref:Uncharacterized protein n=1 Tax=Tanacetum coccineum TaxID=301880 RepID=A0ABQ4ZCK7_9ASTR
MFYKKNVDYATLIWEYFQYQIGSRQTSAKRREQIPYPKFTKVIIHYFLSKHNSLPKRQVAFIHIIKYDSAMGNLKFVSKGKEFQEYGMSIPNLIMNDEIRNSAHYMTYLAMSTNTESPKETKGKGKGGKGNKKKATKEQARIEQAKEEPVVDDQDGMEQARGEKAKVQVPDSAVPNPSSSLTLSSAEYGNMFINENLYVSINDILKDISEPEIQSMVDVDHADVIEESIQANVFNEVKNQLPKLLPQVVSDFVKPRMESTVRDGPQKNPINLFKSSSSSTSIDSFTKYELKNMLYDKMQKSGSFNEHEKHLDLYNALIGSIHIDEAIAKGEIDLTKVLKNIIHDDKDEDPPAEDTVPKVAMGADETMKFEDDVVNVEEQPQDDVALKQDNSIWFKLGNKERKYASSLTKTKAARYELVGIEEIIPRLWSSVKEAYDKNVELGTHYWGPKLQLFYRSRNNATSRHEVFSRLKILSVIRISVDKQFGETDFSRLHPNEIKDMFLLYVQHKIHNLTDDDIVDLMIALRMFTRSIVIKRRVEDVQLRVESYLKKLNITMPQKTFDDISYKEPYTTVYEPKGVVYLNKSNRKRLMRADELYMFSDKTLKSVRDTLHEMLQNFVLGYNHAIPKRAWT